MPISVSHLRESIGRPVKDGLATTVAQYSRNNDFFIRVFEVFQKQWNSQKLNSSQHYNSVSYHLYVCLAFFSYFAFQHSFFLTI